MPSTEFDVFELASRHGPAWFDDLTDGDVTPKLLSTGDRAGVEVKMVELRGRDAVHHVVVKRYHSRPSTPRSQRPRLGDPADATMKPECEFAALADLAAALGRAPSGFAAIRPLEYDDQQRTIIMERFPGRDARPYMRRRNDRGVEALAAGGAALAFAHRVLRRPDRDRLASHDEIDESFTSFCEYLSPLVHEPLIERSRRWWWSKEMPDRAPALGACHADCAPRNLLVDDELNAAWIDGLFRWRAPVHQDVAVFMTSARVRARLTFGRRRASAGDWRAQAFLDGYRRNGDLQVEWLSRFEMLVLLDRLSSLVELGSSVRKRLVRWAVEAELTALVEDGP